jgi:hypothetical protein
LYINYNFMFETKQIGFFENNLICLLDYGSIANVMVPNSSILSVINKSTIEEFRMISETTKIFKMNALIRNLYKSESYQELIRSLEVYIENFNIVS